jgi:hypothetical protein
MKGEWRMAEEEGRRRRILEKDESLESKSKLMGWDGMGAEGRSGLTNSQTETRPEEGTMRECH